MSFVSLGTSSGVIWMDGQLVPWADATLHVLSHGLNNATCVFEGERIYRGAVFRLREHTERLCRSAELIGMPLPFSVDELARATQAVVAAQGLRSGYVRPVAWRGHEQVGILAPHASIHVAIAAFELGDVYSPEQRRRGIKVQVSRWCRPGPTMAPLGAKTSATYLTSALALSEARQARFDDAILLDDQGRLAEATGANLFLVRDGKLLTPPPDRVLDGITRRAVLEIARAQGIPTIERHLEPRELHSADEVFLTGTACEVLPVASIDGRELDRNHRVTSRLVAAFARLVDESDP